MAMKACRSSRASGLALFALVLCSTARPTTHDEAIDVDELLRRVGDLEGGELNLEELLRQAGSGEGARADGSDAAAETSRRAPSYDDDDPDLAEYEPPVRAAGRFRGGFGGNDDDEPEDPRVGLEEEEAATDQDDGGAEGGGTFGLRIDKATLSVLRRWTNFANGVLLILLGPITLAISAGSLQFDKMILSVYVSLFGLIFSAQELRVEPVYSWLRTDFQFMSTHGGRAAFLVFAGNVLWTFGRVGVMPAVFTLANSVFNAKFNSIVARFD